MKEIIKINLKQAQSFANLSGDINPMHLDKIYSRRLMYGKPVAHGINVVFKIFENWLSSIQKDVLIKYVKIKFIHPVYYETEYQLFKIHNDGLQKLILKLNEIKIIEITLDTDHYSKKTQRFFNENIKKIKTPKILNINDSKNFSKSINYVINQRRLAEIFPFSYKKLSFRFINFLISTSYIVGMNIPGLNSIYSQLELYVSKEINSEINLINIKNSKIYHSVNMIKLKIFDNLFDATLNCFFRPPPMIQPKISKIVNYVNSNEFKKMNALVIGGSRGLGELTSKIIIAGSGKVSITYSSGIKEANTIKEEIYNFNKTKISLQKFDIFTDSFKIFSKKFTHIFYFATPKIVKTKGDFFDNEIYENYLNFYVLKFESILNSLSKNFSLKIFYPSTFFIENNEGNFKEYVKAKVEGEKLIDNFKNKKIKIFKPRLPKLDTDQTTGLISEFNSNSTEIMYNYIKQFNRYE